MRSRFGVVVLLCFVMCIGHRAVSTGEESAEGSEQHENAVLRYLLPLVYSSGKAVRVYYSSDCGATTDPLRSAVPFPPVNVQPPSTGKDSLAAIREVFAKDKNVLVEDSNGVIKIRIGKVPAAILATKLSRLTLNGWAPYNPDEVFNAIVATKEMRAAMRSLKFTSVYNPSSGRTEPANGYPHLPTVIRNATAEQVLDEVAKTWAGEVVVMYGACAEPEPSDGQTPFWLGIKGQITPKGLR